jgi:hypothetical protein
MSMSMISHLKHLEIFTGSLSSGQCGLRMQVLSSTSASITSFLATTAS